MASPHIVLVPGFWLGAWAWDEVIPLLEDAGHGVTAITLPGLESPGADRSEVTLEDHVQAIVDAIEDIDGPVVLVLHSGSGFPGYAATDRVPAQVAGVVYVDTGAGVGVMEPEFEGLEYPLPPPDELAENESLDGLTEDHLAEFRTRSIPQPGAALRESVDLTNDARLDIPTTVICTSFSSKDYRDAVEEGYAFVAGLGELRNVTYIDLPTSHWPMWSRPADLADHLDSIARGAG